MHYRAPEPDAALQRREVQALATADHILAGHAGGDNVALADAAKRLRQAEKVAGRERATTALEALLAPVVTRGPVVSDDV